MDFCLYGEWFANFHFASGGRFPRALPQPLHSLRSLQGLRHVLNPQESPPSASFKDIS